MELDGETPIKDEHLKVLPRVCYCHDASADSAVVCPRRSRTTDTIGGLADALFLLPGKGKTYKEEGLEWQGSTPCIVHPSKQGVAIRFLTLYRGHEEEQVDGSKKVVGGNCGINLEDLDKFLNALDKAKKEKAKLLFLYKEAFKILVEGFSPASFTVHTAEEGVLRLHAENVCGEWPFDSVEPASFKRFEKVRQELCQQAHKKYWDEEKWGVWKPKPRAKRDA